MENETKARMINTSKLELSLWAGFPSSWNWSQTLWNLSTLQLVSPAEASSQPWTKPTTIFPLPPL